MCIKTTQGQLSYRILHQITGYIVSGVDSVVDNMILFIQKQLYTSDRSWVISPMNIKTDIPLSITVLIMFLSVCC